MKGLLIALAAAISLTCGIAIAQDESNVVLTPTALYEMIAKLQAADLELLSRSEFAVMVKRVRLIEDVQTNHQQRLRDWEKTGGLFAAHEMHLKQRIGELERKVAGMQKQITILHGKADK